jgi:ketosteroid isomerase-like protein
LSNADIVRANSEAFSRLDVAAMLEFYAPDAVVTDRRPVGWGEFRGHESLRSYYQGLLDNAAELHEDLEIVDERDDVIIASCHMRARLVDPPDAPEVSFDYALRIVLTDGLIASMEIFEDADAAALRPTR